MSPEERQKALDDITPEDLAKIKAHQAKTRSSIPVDNEWLLLAEFLKFAGWQAYLDAKNDRRDEKGNLIVSTEEMMTLIEANRKLEAIAQFKAAFANFVGAVSAQTKKPTATFNRLTKTIIKDTKVDD